MDSGLKNAKTDFFKISFFLYTLNRWNNSYENIRTSVSC